MLPSPRHPLPRSPRRVAVTAFAALPTLAMLAMLAMLVALALVATPLRAQTKEGSKSIVGTWSGTATVPLKDSSIVVPVVYTFTQGGTAVGGTAMVPGQGAGPISDVVRNGDRLSFNVSAPEGKVLEHDGAFTADGAIEGMVHLDKQPVAKFRITPKKGETPGR